MPRHVSRPPTSHSTLRSTPHDQWAGEDRLRDFSTDRRLVMLMLMAVIVGCAGAVAAWTLYHLIAFVTNIAYYGRLSAALASPPVEGLRWTSVLIPVAGCLLIGFMARWGSERIRGHGIPEAMEAILIGRSRMQPRVALLKPLSSAISIGTGGPFGAEGPIIMTGGAFGSLFAQLFKLSNAERKTLLVAGAAAGMSATFGTPVAAMLLAVELLLFEWKPRSFVPVAIASLVAAALRPYLMGHGVLFPMPQSAAMDPLGLVLAGVLGVIAGLCSGVLTQMVYACEDAFQRLPIHWMWWPAIGGVVIGVGGLIDPHALGVGYVNIAALLAGTMTGMQAVRLLLVKSVIWSVALGSGTSGGVLAPLLMMGGAIGVVFGSFVPFGDHGTWALVGMASIMAGTMRSPLTSIVFALELTHNTGGLLPVAAACVMAHATTVLLLRRSILTEKVARRGHHVMREYVVDPFETMRVYEIMAHPVETLPADMLIGDVVEYFTADSTAVRHKSYPVVNAEAGLAGIVSRADVLRWTVEGWPTGERLRDVISEQDLTIGYTDELVGELADRMSATDASRVPVLRRADGAVVGLVARRDLLLVRKDRAQSETEREAMIRLRGKKLKTTA
jgi:CIC family chloride channel protein